MQGNKHCQEKFFVNFRLSERVPAGNFYRRLKESIDLDYLCPLTKGYYGSEGHKSIDPVVFFKLMLVGYLENICSDRKIAEQCSLRLDVLYFLGYDIDEPLPWHSTLSRTRQLLGEEAFLGFFRDILRMCIEKGLVDGRTQAVDSAFIKANASHGGADERELAARSKSSSAKDCRGCPLKAQCCKNKNYKRIDHSSDKPYYDEAYERVRTAGGRRRMRLRSSTVEPVLGTLLNFRRMKKVYTIGRESACKQLLMAAAAYNLNKLMGAMGFKRVKAAASAAKNALLDKIPISGSFISVSGNILAMP